MPEVIGIDHIYIAVADMAISEQFYDKTLVNILGFRKNKFELNSNPHIQYFNRHFGFVIRPSKIEGRQVSGTPGLHHFCFRVDSISEVKEVSKQFQKSGIMGSEAQQYPEYAFDYWATYFADPDGIEFEVTNYRQERRDRYENWQNQS